jgi:hypothetical protein
MNLSTVTCEIWEKLKIPDSNNYKIFFKDKPLIVDSRTIIFVIENTKDFFIELNKFVDMGQFSKVIIENTNIL